jgi:DNA-binding transcriptional ArsR family regulator
MENCIRDCADINQLNRCQTALSEIQSELERKARVLNLAGNEVRLKILFLLNMEKAMCPCDLSDVLKMTVPAVSQHLKKLKDADLITRKKEGQTIFYSINEAEATLLLPIIEKLNGAAA